MHLGEVSDRRAILVPAFTYPPYQKQHPTTAQKSDYSQ